MKGRETDYGKSWRVAENALRCVKCGQITDLKHCPNCGSPYYKESISTEGIVGAFCEKCQKGFTNWTCQICGCENPVKNTVVIRGGCFIATAAYGSPLAQEVVILQSFRDEVLARRSYWGRAFITGYYHFSPFYAHLISQSEILKKVVRTIIITPLVRRVKSFQNRKG